MLTRAALFPLLFITVSSGFLQFWHTSRHQPRPLNEERRRTRLLSSSDETPPGAKQNRVDDSVRNKLLAESIAPWRTLRLFLYGSLGSGALVGGFITLTGVFAAVSKGSTDVDLKTEYLNLAIDFGAVLAFALLTKFDLEKQGELDKKVEERLEEKKMKQQLTKGMKERELQLRALELTIKVSSDGDTRDVTVKEIQVGAQQNMIIIAGPNKACRDALVGARIQKMDFAMSNVLVVPYSIDLPGEKVSRPDGSGFGNGGTPYESQPYVARPKGEGWSQFLQGEMEDAIRQNGDCVRSEGIVLIVAKTGNVIKRGVGKVPWRQVVEELQSVAS